MGYTTEFEGKFECRCLNEPQVGDFLHAVHAGDRGAMAPLADWLIEHADPRGEAIAMLLTKRSEPAEEFWYHFRLKPEHADYLNAFSETRRMRRNPAIASLLPDPRRLAVGLPIGDEGGYFTGGIGDFGQEHDDSVLDGNRPPRGQPGLWCQWVSAEHGTAIQWNGAEKFYHYVEWLEYLIAHFLGPWGYVLNGQVRWQGEEEEDRGTITVRDNEVEARAE